MIRRDGTISISGRVLLFDQRDVFIIERDEIRRILIQFTDLQWVTKDGKEFTFEFKTDEGDGTRCSIVSKIFDSIVFETGAVVWLKSPITGRWARLDDADIKPSGAREPAGFRSLGETAFELITGEKPE